MNFKKLLMIVICLIGIFSSTGLFSQARLSQGAFNTSLKAYQPLSSWDGSATNTYYYTTIYMYLPFDFYYDGVLTRYISMNACGGLKLSNYSYSPYYSYPFYKYQDYYGYESINRETYYRYYGGFIYPFWMDHWPIQEGKEHSMKYRVEGSYPNRRAVYEWLGNVFDYMNTSKKHLKDLHSAKV